MLSDKRHGDIHAGWKREENSWLWLHIWPLINWQGADWVQSVVYFSQSADNQPLLKKRVVRSRPLKKHNANTYAHAWRYACNRSQPSCSSNSHQGWVEAAVACIKAWGHIREASVSREDHTATVRVPPRSPHLLIPLGTPPVPSLPLVWGGELGQLWSPVAPHVQRLVQAQVRLPSWGQWWSRGEREGRRDRKSMHPQHYSVY